MKLKVLSLQDVEQVRLWRNEIMESLRTSFPLTEEMQQNFYSKVICDRKANSRFWAVKNEQKELIGMVGLEGIEIENRRAEISIILKPDMRGKGHGEIAVDMLLDKGFNYLNLDNIFGEVYKCNKAFTFWEKIIKKYNAYYAMTERVKYFNGMYYDGMWFNITKEKYNNA